MAIGGAAVESLLVEARRRIHLPPHADISARIAAANLAYGLARVLAALRTLVPDADVSYRASPDFTVTRTAKRWQGGFAYGGEMVLETGGLELVVPELRPNACGTLVGRLERTITTEEMIRRASALRAESSDTVWDYSRRNHFINLYLSEERQEQVFVIHGCPAHIRFDTDDGPGIDANKSVFWRPHIEWISGPLGDLGVLTGENARRFWRNFRRCELLSLADRTATAERIFGPFEEVQNVSHVGMSSPCSYFHGCHVDGAPGALYPVLTRPGASVYLVEAVRNGDGAEPGLLPHGTGYLLDFPEPLRETTDPDRRRPIFLLGDPGRGGQQVYGDLSSVPFAYREPSLVADWQDQGLLSIRETLIPMITAKL
ncbi:MAG: hypothetical protein MI919_16230 [Holophagales bacterium]|nr:hypothetical protein [Holophagales bacterium]